MWGRNGETRPCRNCRLCGGVCTACKEAQLVRIRGLGPDAVQKLSRRALRRVSL